jgi:hypothetical protein
MSSKALAFAGTIVLIAVTLIIGSTGSMPTTSGDSTPVAFAQQAAANGEQADDKKENMAEDESKAPPGALRQRKVAEFVSSLLQTARDGGATVLSEGDSYDDFVSSVQTPDGTVYVAYAAYYDGHDQIRVHKQMPDGRWSTRTNVPLVNGDADIWMPQLAVDAQNRLWVIWCEQTGRSAQKSGNWDLYARALEGQQWGPIVRLTDDPRPDINPHVFSDAEHRIHIVWQAHPENNGDIQYCRFDGKAWSKPLAVTSDAESDWYPHGAVDSQGKVWVAFDSYRNGDYDVFLTSLEGDKPGPVIPVAASPFYEAHPSIATTADGRVWVAWERGGHNWGKDQGHWLQKQNRNQGTTLGNTRNVHVACYHEGKIWSAPEIKPALPQVGRNQPTALAELTTGTDGRLWLACRHLTRGQRRPNGTFTRGWTENVTSLTADGWQPFVELPGSAGRISVFSRIRPLKSGQLLVSYSADARSVENYHRPIQDTAMVMSIDKPASEPGIPVLKEYVPPSSPAGVAPWNSAREVREVNAIRNVRTTIDGKAHRIVRGDLHRHSEMSWDVGPGNDGSYLDFYRYMIDVAAMDFGSLTDHQGGGHYAYWWWLTEKSADMYHLAPRFVPLYGYERSVTFPHGHRNVFHATRSVPIFPFQIRMDQVGVFPGVGGNNVLDNDTKLLYEFLHNSGGISIPHTSATSTMGTDWRDNDPEVEPVVEMYQGARNSSETLDAPRVHPSDEAPGKAPGGFQKAGLVWNAYAKGYRLGTITASDHGSTHISYAIVYTPENDRRSIIDSIRRRHTYGATSNLIVDFQANGHFMGDEFTTKENPTLTLRATGTAKITDARLIRNNEYIYTTAPNKSDIELKYTDMAPKLGTNLYYFRLVQEDGEVAWSSPIWVNIQ